MRRLYIAGASAEIDMVAAYMKMARERGWAITFDWTRDVFEARAAGVADSALSDDRRAALAVLDLEGVRLADAVWLLVPPPGRSAGAWLELGYAISMQKRIVVSGDYRRSIFTSLASKCFEHHTEVLDFLGDAS